MSQRDRSLLMPQSQLNISGVLSQLNSKQMVQSHISEIMPSFQGGKKQVQYIIMFVPESSNIARNYEGTLKNQLVQQFGQFLEYRTFKDKRQILDENLKENVLYYIVADENLYSWAEKFSRQQRQQSNGKKYIGVIRMVKKNKFEELKKAREKHKSNKNLKNEHLENYIIDMNLSSDDNKFRSDIQSQLVPFIEEKLTVAMDKQKNKAKNWAISNKYKKNKAKKEKLYLYVEKDGQGNIIESIQNAAKMTAKKGRYKWVQIIPFESYRDIIEHIQRREDEIVEECQIASQASQIFTSRLLDKSASKIGTSSKYLSNIKSQTLSPSTISSRKHIPSGQIQHKISRQDSNYILCSKDFDEFKKVYHFVLAQKRSNWKLLQYSDANIADIRNQIAKMIVQNRKKEDDMMELSIVSAKTLYLFAPYEDAYAQNIYRDAKNYFRNTEMMLYESGEQLRSCLNQYSRNIQNYTVVLLKYNNSQEHRQVLDFIQKNVGGMQDKEKQLELGNLTYRFTTGANYNSGNSYLSMNSIYNYNSNQSAYEWLHAVLEDRDRYFHPLDGLQGRNIYLLARYDYQNELIDPYLQKKVENSPRLQKASYRDENYLKHFIKNIRRKRDSVIVLTNDQTLREAQEIVKDFDEVAIMNITERNMKEQLKVLAWGPKSSIYQIIDSISQKKQKLRRMNYNQIKPSLGFERQHRILPKKIDFSGGKNITVRIQENEDDKNSGIMENNLDHYFDEEIRFEYYNNPNQIRLLNKKQEPLSFIICKDKADHLDYMKKISKEEKDQLRQEYILYTRYPDDYRYLVEDSKYPRFRFISNSWQKIEDYIIGVYQLINGFDNDSIYQDQLIHIFYYPRDQRYIDYLKNMTMNQPIYKNLRLHQLAPGYEENIVNQTLALQSPHHLFFFLVNEKEGAASIDDSKKLIDKCNSSYKYYDKGEYRVPKKDVQMIVIKENRLAGKDSGVKATFSTGQQAVEYIAGTKIKPANFTELKPHIIINRSTQDWYYFLSKYQKIFDRYQFHYIDEISQLNDLVRKIRDKQYGSKIWILLNKQTQLRDYSRAIKHLDRGLNIDFIYHGDGWISKEKIIMNDGNREQIQALLLNSHKRSTRYFSPESLQSFSPKVFMSNSTASRVMISQEQKKKWQIDLNAEFYSGSNPPQDFKNSNRPIVLIEDINEDTHLKGFSHVRRIIYDSNEKNRQKSHDLTEFYPNKRDIYTGYYPAEINEYLRFLRFNIKNPPNKIARSFPNQLTMVYKEDNIEINKKFEQILQRKNNSIVKIIDFNNLEQAIRDSKKYPEYNHLFLVGKKNLQKLRTFKGQYNYIAFDKDHRVNPLRSQAQLQTEDQEEYKMYLFNLPQKRFDKAKKLKKILNVYSMQKSPVAPVARELAEINKRNKAFKLTEYYRINDLKQVKEEAVVLATNEMEKDHRSQLPNLTNITYFILDEDRLRYLETNQQKHKYFITKSGEQCPAFFQNAKIFKGSDRINQQKPIINIPSLLKKSIQISHPLNLHLFKNRSKLQIYPPFQLGKDKGPPAPIIEPFNKHNIIDNSNPSIFHLPSTFRPDSKTSGLEIKEFYIEQVKPIEPIKPIDPIIIPPSPAPKPDPEILKLTIDEQPQIIQQNFCNITDEDNILPHMHKPKPRKIDRTLAVLYPQSRQFTEILKVLKDNLDPKCYVITQFPYKSDYDLENYFRNDLQKFESGYDKTLFFFYPQFSKYVDNLKMLKSRMGSRLQYYMFQDDFHNHYRQFKEFLPPYPMRNHSIPYINKEDSEFWLSSTLFNVMVPINRKKRYDSLKGDNVRVLIYKPQDLQSIANQLHCQNQFIIIVCSKQDYHKLKHFPRLSPRCLIVIQDTEILKVDQVPLFRYPRKVLYYGPDALTYLQKYRIPSKVLPIKQETLKTLFFNPKFPGQYQQAVSEHYTSYEKVPYQNHEDLFVKLIGRFKNCNNFKLPNSRSIKTPIKLNPKLYMEKDASYQTTYKNQFSTIQSRSEFKPSFKADIRPSQYAHLPIKYYDGHKDLLSDLEKEDCPCLVYIDINYRQYQKLVRDFRDKHLFLMMFDFRDRWIEKNGDLTPTHLLARPEQLTIKQLLFTNMFNQQVFDTYNDMGYFYLSNKADTDKKRNITFMTKQKLQTTFKQNPNLLMVVFVQSSDKHHIPALFYNPVQDRSQNDRIKLIFLHHRFINNQFILYIKFNEIDPVIYHINRVQLSGRVDYCLYPTGELGNLIWHKFSQLNKGYESLAYNTIEEVDRIAQDIKGKFRHVMIICDKQDYQNIQGVLAHYSIKTKEMSNQRVTYQFIPDIQKKSYALANEAIKKSSILHFQEQDENNQKFQTVGHGIDIKASSGHYNDAKIQDIIQGKNFVLSVNEKLRDTFPIGNFYASKVKYFKDLKRLSNSEPGKSQVIISHQKYSQIQNITIKNPDLFLVYVSNEMPSGQNGNILVIKQQQIPALISKLQGSARNNKELLNGQSELNIKNIQEYKVVRIVYDKNIEKQAKKKILNASIKNKNIVPALYKNMNHLKDMLKEDGSLVLLMMSKEPAQLKEELMKQDFQIVQKRKTRMIVPRRFDSAIDGLSTILEQHQSQMEYIQGNNLTESNINLYLNMIQKNPEKNKNILMSPAYQSHDEQQQKQSYKGIQNDHENITKLRVHSVIRQDNLLDEEEIDKIRQRLDGGVIVVVVEKKHTESAKQILNRYNVLIQEYSHAVNLDQSIRDRKDKVTIVVIQKNMLESIIPIKKQFPRLVFILLNQNRDPISKEFKPFISGEIHKINDVQMIISDIYEQNEKIKYSDQLKNPSRFDNRRVSTVDVGNSERFSVGFNNTRAKKAFVFFKEPQNSMTISKLSQTLNNIKFVPYKDSHDLPKIINTYQGYQSILIANKEDIPELEEYVSKKKEQIYVIRYNPPNDLRQNPKIKMLLSTSSEQDISNYLIGQFQRNSLTSERTISSKMNIQKNIPETKNYVQKYEPNTFGTTPRFQQDFVPPKSKESTYSKRYLKSNSKPSKISGRDMRSMDPRSVENSEYYH